MEQFWHWFEYGGVMLIFIALASLLGISLFLARWRAHRPGRVLPPVVRATVLKSVAEQNWERAMKSCQENPSSLSRVYEEGLRFRSAERREIREAMEEVGRREMNRLERFVGTVGAMASVTPLMGLLGTVMGMIKVFQVVVDDAAADGMADATLLANGIWEALVTTAAGLAVAIPLYLAYRYLLGGLDALSVNLEEAASELLDRLAPPPHAGDPDPLNKLTSQASATNGTAGRETTEALAAEGV